MISSFSTTFLKPLKNGTSSAQFLRIVKNKIYPLKQRQEKKRRKRNKYATLVYLFANI